MPKPENSSMTPAEMLLERLTQRVAKAAEASCRMSGGEQAAVARRELGEARRSLEVRRLLWNARTIAVTGLQGAGKSTFTVALLGLADKLRDFVPISHARDEKLCILIREHADTNVRGGAIVFRPRDDGKPELEEVALRAAEFINAARNPPADYLLMTLRVPRCLFGDDEQGLLLTPGIERKQDSWSVRAREAVYASQQVVLVADVTQLAGERREELTEIASSFRGCRFTAVLTHCDQLTDSGRDEASQGFSEVIGIPGRGADIVQFGLGKGNAPTWGGRTRDDVIRLIARQTGTPAVYRDIQNAQTKALVEDDGPLARGLYALAGLADDALEGAARQDRTVESVLNRFRSGRDKARRRLQTKLRESAGSEDFQRAVEVAIQDRGTWEKLKTWVSGFDLKDKHWLEDRVRDAWIAGKPGALAATAFSGVAEEGLEPYLGTGATAQPRNPLQGPELHHMLALDGQADLPAAQGIDSTQMASVAEQPELPTIAGFLPYWGMALVGTGAGALAKTKSWQPGEIRQLDNKFIAETLANLKSTSQFSRQLVATVVGTVAAADLGDGSAIAISTALSKAGITLTATMSAVLTGAAAVAALGVVAVSIKRQLGAMDLQMAGMGQQLVIAHQDALVQAGLDRFDAVMDQLEVRLDLYVRRRLGQHDQMNAAMQTRFAVADAEAARKELLARLTASRYLAS